MASGVEPQPAKMPAGVAGSPVRRGSRDRSRAAVPGRAGGAVGANGGIRLLGVTGNMHNAMSLCERLRPDVVMVDPLLDPRCHLASCWPVPTTPVAILSVVREPLRSPRYVAAAMGSGVQGLVLRSAEPQQVLDAIRRTHLERRYLDPELAALATGLGVRHTVTARQPLSRREYQVLQLISDGMENQAIAKSLFVSVETIRTHVKSILRKLHARDRAHAVAVAFRLGVLVAHREGPVMDVPAARLPVAERARAGVGHVGAARTALKPAEPLRSALRSAQPIRRLKSAQP